MKKEYKAPLTDIVYLSIGEILQEADGTTDSLGHMNGDDAGANDSFFEESESDFTSSKNLW